MSGVLRDAWRVTPATMGVHLSNNKIIPKWLPAPHLTFVSHKIASAIHNGMKGSPTRYIVVSEPPRHGKSELISFLTPMWVLENWPHARVILASYGAELAAGFGRRARDAFMGHPEVFSPTLKADSLQASRWETTSGGGMYSVGAGGPITGRGANVLIVDDLIKNFEEAQSATYRERTWNWFAGTAFTRLEPGGVVIVVSTRWHSDDIVGRIEQNAKDLSEDVEWEFVSLPARAMSGDPLGRKLDEPLWESRYSAKALNVIRKTVGGYIWGALYQQSPTSVDKAMFQGGWFSAIDIAGDLQKSVRFWDLAATEPKVGADPDYTVGLRMDYTKSGVYIVSDLTRDRKTPADVETMVKRAAHRDGPDVSIVMEQEPGSAGKNTIAHYAKNVIPGYQFKGVRATGDKVARVQPVMAVGEDGRVRLLRRNWNQDLQMEVDQFPFGRHDDQVIALAGAYTELATGLRRGVTWGRVYTGAEPEEIAVGAESGQIRRGIVFGRN